MEDDVWSEGAFVVNGSPVTAGVTGPDPAIGGRDSNSEAPNDEVGLKGFKPCRRDCPGEVELNRGVEGTDWADERNDVLVKPVGWVERDDENKESDPVAELVADFVPSLFCTVGGVTVVLGWLFTKAKDEATLEISAAPGFSEELPKSKFFQVGGSGCVCCSSRFCELVCG